MSLLNLKTQLATNHFKIRPVLADLLIQACKTFIASASGPKPRFKPSTRNYLCSYCLDLRPLPRTIEEQQQGNVIVRLRRDNFSNFFFFNVALKNEFETNKKIVLS